MSRKEHEVPNMKLWNMHTRNHLNTRAGAVLCGGIGGGVVTTAIAALISAAAHLRGEGHERQSVKLEPPVMLLLLLFLAAAARGALPREFLSV